MSAEWPAVEQVHGRTCWRDTPPTSPTLSDYEPARRKRLALRRARIRLAVLAGLAAMLAVALLTITGCAHQPAGAVDTIVLNERIGGPVAFVLEQLTGQAPKATTLPYLPTIVFQPEDANDTCLMVHEGVHRMDQVDMGGASWGAEYLRELVECERERPPAECLRTIELERRGYEAQHKCLEHLSDR